MTLAGGRSEALAPVTVVSRMLARYRAWATHRDVLSVVEDDPGAWVSATEWQASDDEGADLAHGLARLLSDTRRNAVPDRMGGVVR